MNSTIKKLVVVSVACSSLAACAPAVQFSSERSVMVNNVRRANQAEAMRVAEAECQKYHRHAVAIPDNVRDGNQSYECKD